MGKKDKLSVRKETRKSSEPVSIPAVVSTVKRTKSKTPKTKKVAPPPPPSPSSSEEDSSDADAESEIAPVTSTKHAVVKGDSLNQSSSSEDEEPSKAAISTKKKASSNTLSLDSHSDAPPASAAVTKVVRSRDSSSSESDSDSDSDSSESKSPDLKPASSATKAVVSGNNDSGPGSDSDSKKSESNSSTSDDSDSDGDGDVTMKDATNSTKRKAESDAVLPAKKAKLATESTTESGTLSTLWVGNLSWNVNDDWLKGEFEGYGEVISARVQMDRNTGRSRGFAYVEFKEPVSAQKALADTSKEIDGRAPRMDIAPPRGEPDQTKRAKAFNDKVSDPSSILFVGNLSFESTEDGIWEAFSDFGEILNVRIPTDRDSGQKKGFGYVEFGDQASATKAFGSLQGKELFGRPVRLDYSHPRDNNAGGGRGRGGGGDRGFRGRGGDGRGGRGGRGRGSFDRGGRGGGFGGFGGDSGGRGGRGRGPSRGRGQGAVSSFEGKKTTF